MRKHKIPNSCHGTVGKLSKEEADCHGTSGTRAPVSRTRARDASKEHKSDLTIEKGNPISHMDTYFKAPGTSKFSRPRSPSANEMFEGMSKRRALISEGPQPSTLYQSPYFPLHPKSQSGATHTFGGADSSSDQYLNNGAYVLRSFGSLTGYQKSETGITNPYPRYSVSSFGNTHDIQSYKWENSVPFRPSFPWPKIDSFARAPYDPLIDSINPPGKTGSEDMKISPENSPGAASNNISGIGENSPNYNPSNYSCKVKTKLAPQELNEVSNEMSSSNNHADRAFPGRPGNRDSAELKVFRVALAEFIKELVKPAWKKGILSNDAHKMIVKKASDKVVSSVQPHLVPNSQESAKQYISTYKPKIENLVEDYLGIYCKRERSTKSEEMSFVV